MGDLSKLKVAVGQPELVDEMPSHNFFVQEKMVALAVEAGADLLVLPGSLSDATDVRLIALNDSRIDVAGNVVILEAAGESYQIGLGSQPQGCDFAVFSDLEPWADKAPARASWPGIVMRPVGMRNVDKKVLAFDGGTSVFANDGTLLARLRDDFEEDFALVSLSERGEIADPCRNKLLAALVKTLRRFDEQVLTWKPNWVIGLSGGLDSSIVAAIITLALGSERVRGFNLATAFNSPETKANATALADALGITLRNGSIEGLVEATEAAVRAFGYAPKEGEENVLGGLALENVQARVRGNLLSTFAALEGGVVANNGNRVECAFGYATLYGDAIGALAPIGDLTKTRLFELARAINGQPGVEVIPENLLPEVTEGGYNWAVMPSAELSDGQKDPMKWFYHDWLVEQLLDSPNVDAGACSILGHYLDDRLQSLDVAKWVRFYGLDDPKAFVEEFDWAMKSMRTSAFKRIQSPPIIKVASPASISSPLETQGEIEPSIRYKELRARIAQL
ncbi:MAG: NAD(+) synthase [Eggerthellaceae bacterium]|nr:NAD(+) synthase [Eggerthellaceae bacterium]